MDEITGSASRYLKKAIHKGYRIFVSVSVEHRVFCPWPHSLPVEHRKSRNSSFFPDIVRPPNVVLFSYIRRPFVYCLLFTDLFNHGLTAFSAQKPAIDKMHQDEGGKAQAADNDEWGEKIGRL